MLRGLGCIADTGGADDSPYAALSFNGATIYPRALFLVTETTNTAIVQAAQTVTVNPRMGSYDKAPWKNLDLSAITGQTVESLHLFNVHLGETIVPYVVMDPLKALLPLKRDDLVVPIDGGGTGGVSPGGLEPRMRGRWQTISALWEGNKTPANQLNLLGQLDYLHKLSSQLDWQQTSDDGTLRVVYTKSGEPTAGLLQDNTALVDHLLYWISCQGVEEAHYLLAIINSDVLKEAVHPLMTKGQFGPRDLHKKLWKLPIPEFDPTQELHGAIAAAGAAAAVGAQTRMAEVREEQGAKLTGTKARSEVRKWLRASTEGKAVEAAVARLLTSE